MSRIFFKFWKFISRNVSWRLFAPVATPLTPYSITSNIFPDLIMYRSLTCAFSLCLTRSGLGYKNQEVALYQVCRWGVPFNDLPFRRLALRLRAYRSSSDYQYGGTFTLLWEHGIQVVCVAESQESPATWRFQIDIPKRRRRRRGGGPHAPDCAKFCDCDHKHTPQAPR